MSKDKKFILVFNAIIENDTQVFLDNIDHVKNLNDLHHLENYEHRPISLVTLTCIHHRTELLEMLIRKGGLFNISSKDSYSIFKDAKDLKTDLGFASRYVNWGFDRKNLDKKQMATFLKMMIKCNYPLSDKDNIFLRDIMICDDDDVVKRFIDGGIEINKYTYGGEGNNLNAYVNSLIARNNTEMLTYLIKHGLNLLQLGRLSTEIASIEMLILIKQAKDLSDKITKYSDNGLVKRIPYSENDMRLACNACDFDRIRMLVEEYGIKVLFLEPVLLGDRYDILEYGMKQQCLLHGDLTKNIMVKILSPDFTEDKIDRLYHSIVEYDWHKLLKEVFDLYFERTPYSSCYNYKVWKVYKCSPDDNFYRKCLFICQYLFNKVHLEPDWIIDLKNYSSFVWSRDKTDVYGKIDQKMFSLMIKNRIKFSNILNEESFSSKLKDYLENISPEILLLFIDYYTIDVDLVGKACIETGYLRGNVITNYELKLENPLVKWVIRYSPMVRAYCARECKNSVSDSNHIKHLGNDLDISLFILQNIIVLNKKNYMDYLDFYICNDYLEGVYCILNSDVTDVKLIKDIYKLCKRVDENESTKACLKFIDLRNDAGVKALSQIDNKVALEAFSASVSSDALSAVKNNDLQRLNDLVSKGASFEDTLEPLFEAVERGYLEICHVLLANKANPNETDYDYDEKSPLLIALEKGHNEIAILLMKYGAKFTKFNNRYISEFAYAASTNNTDVLDEMFSRVKPKDYVGRVAVDIYEKAIMSGNLELVKRVVDQFSPLEFMNRGLAYTILYGLFDIADFLIQEGVILDYNRDKNIAKKGVDLNKLVSQYKLRNGYIEEKFVKYFVVNDFGEHLFNDTHSKERINSSRLPASVEKRLELFEWFMNKEVLSNEELEYLYRKSLEHGAFEFVERLDREGIVLDH